MCGDQLSTRSNYDPGIYRIGFLVWCFIPLQHDGGGMKLKVVTKFVGWCRECGGTVPLGKTVYWEKGKGIRHIECVRMADIRTRTYTPTPVPRSPKKHSPAGSCLD